MTTTTSRFWTRPFAALLALALLVGMLAANRGVIAAPEDAALLRSAYIATTATQAFRFASTRTVSIGGETVPTYIIEADGDQVLPDRTRTSTSVMTGEIRVSAAETAKVGADMYLFLSAPFAPNGIEQWVKLDAFGGLVTGVLNPVAAPQAAPLDALALLNAATDPRTVGDATVGGTMTTQVRAAVNVSQAAGAGGPLGGLGIVTAGTNPTATLDVYIGKGDNLVRRMTLTSDVRVDLGTLNLGGLVSDPAGTGMTDARTAVTFDFADYNAAGITVEPPPGAISTSSLLGGFSVNITFPNVAQPTATPRPTIRGR